MVKIIRKNFKTCGELFDFELNNGILLHRSEWNGYEYTVKSGNEPDFYKNCRYVPNYNKFNEIESFEMKH